MRQLAGHTKGVRTVAFAPDGRLISGGEDRTVRVWDVAAGTATQVIQAKRVIYAVAVSPDGGAMAYAGRTPAGPAGTNVVHVWDLPTGLPTAELECEPTVDARSVWSLSFSHDSTHLAAAVRRLGGGNILNGGGGRWWKLTRPHGGGPLPYPDAFAVAFATHDASVALTVEKAVVVLDRPGGAEVRRYKLTAAWAADLAFVPRSAGLVVAMNSFVYYFDTATAAKPHRVRTAIPNLKSLAVAPDGRSVFVGGRPGRVERYGLPDLALLHAYDFGLGHVDAMAVSPDGLTFAVGGEHGLIVCDAE